MSQLLPKKKYYPQFGVSLSLERFQPYQHHDQEAKPKNGPSRVGDVGKHIRWTERQRGKKGCSIEKSNKKSNTPLPPLNEPITISRVILSEGAPARTDRTNAVEQYLRLLSATAIHGEMLRYLMKRTGGRTQPDRPSWPRGVWFEIMHECTITSRLSTFRLGRSSRV